MSSIPVPGTVPDPGRKPARVLVASPFTVGTTTADQVAAWQAAAQLEADGGTATDTLVFAICAAVDPGTPAPEIDVPGVTVLVVERTADPAKAAAAGQIIERIRLTREASEARVDIVWFLDLNIRPPRGGWDAMRDEIAQGAGAVLIPYPLAPLDGSPGVVVIGKNVAGNNVLVMVDSWTRAAETGRASFPAVGGGLGCTAIPIYTFLVVKFAVATLDAVVVGPGAEPEKRALSGEALGWYMNALRSQVPIRAIAGAVCTVAP